MTPEEYRQITAFARVDGALLAGVWTVSFACNIAGMDGSMLVMAGLLLAVCSPFFVASRLRKFRDGARDGIISFMQAYAYTALAFFYAAILFAVVQFVYFRFIDNGYVMSHVMAVMNDEQTRQALTAYGMADAMDESIRQMAQTRPIDYAMGYLPLNILAGLILGLPIAAVMQRRQKQ